MWPTGATKIKHRLPLRLKSKEDINSEKTDRQKDEESQKLRNKAKRKKSPETLRKGKFIGSLLQVRFVQHVLLVSWFDAATLPNCFNTSFCVRVDRAKLMVKRKQT